VSDLLDTYLKWLTESRRLSENTLMAYGHTLTTLEGVHADHSEVSTEELEDFLKRSRRGGRDAAAATMARERHAIRGFYAWLHARGHIPTNPGLEVAVPKVRNRSPKALPDGTWARLWATPMSLDDRVWLGLGFFAGLRRYELATVAPSEVDTRTERLVNMKRKGGGLFPVEYGQMARVIARDLPELLPNPDVFLADVAALVDMRAGEKFLAPSSRGDVLQHDVCWFNRRLRTLLREAGLPQRTCTPHALRHSCATNLLRCGVPIELIADLLSHSSLDTTRRYLDTSGRLERWAGAT